MRKGFAPDDETGEELDGILTVLYLVITPIAMLVRKKIAEIFLKNDDNGERKIRICLCKGRERERKGQCISYGNGNIGNTGNGGDHSQRFPDKEICVLRTGYGGKEAAPLLSGQFFPDWHCVPGFWKRCRNNGGITYDRVQYLSWKKKIQAVRTVSDDTVYGHHQWTFCSGTACAAVFLCVVGTGDCRLSVYPLWVIDCIVFLVLCERKKLASLVSREYASQEPAKIREIFALGNRDLTYVFLQYG